MSHLQLLLAIPSLGFRTGQLGRAKSPLAGWPVRCLTAQEEAAAGMELSSTIRELLSAPLTGDLGLHALGTENLVPGHRGSDARGAVMVSSGAYRWPFWLNSWVCSGCPGSEYH